MATRNGFVPEAVFKFDHLETRVQNHLKRVYGCLAISMFAAAAGAYIHLFTNLMQRITTRNLSISQQPGESQIQQVESTCQRGSHMIQTKISLTRVLCLMNLDLMQAGLLTAIASIGLMLWLASTHHSKENETKRIAIFTGFTFLAGMSLGPLLDQVIRIDPSIIMTAFMGTSVIFICFSFAALYSQNRTFLYMGGFLLSALSWLVLMGFMNIFFGSKLLYDINLYGGLLLFCAFILYDTQLIVEKARHGDDDYIWHSVDLFLDFINIFRRLLIILASKKEDSDKKRRN